MADFSQLSQEELDRLYLEAQRGIQAAPLSHIQGTNRFGENVTGGEFDRTPQAVADVMDLSQVPTEELDRIYRNARPMGLAEDMGRSAVTGLEKGTTGLIATPSSLLNMWGQGVDNIGSWALEKTGAWTPEQARGYREDSGKWNYAHINGLADAQDLDTLVQRHAGPYHQPQTAAGRYTESIAEMIPGSALIPGGAVAKGTMAVGSGVGAQAAGDLSNENPMARMGGAVVGGLASGGVNALRAAPQRIVGNALQGVEPAAVADAIALMRAAEQHGVRLTVAEAIQQVTDGATGMGRMQRVIEGTKRGGEELAPMFTQRPNQVRDAGMNFADQIAPPNQQPSMIGRQAQEAAQSGLDMTRGVINDAARPHYQALRGQLIPDADFAALQQNPSYRGALEAVRSNPELNHAIAGLPDNDLAVVNEVVKQLDTAATAARQTVQNPAGNNYLSSLRGDARSQADQLAGNVSPDWRAARDTVAQGRAQYLEPLEAGPAGQIARTDNVPTQTGALYPASPLEGAANETPQALTIMRAAEAEAANRSGQPIAMPGAGADLTRQHWVNTLNQTMADLQPGPNQWGGAKFAKAIAGNPEQERVLQAGVRTVAGDPVVGEMDTLLRVLRATGKREAQGSKTAFNAEDIKDLKANNLGTRLKDAANPIRWGDAIGNAVSDIQYRRNVERLARLLQATPDEAEAFLGQAQRAGPRQSSLLARALMAGAAGNP